MLSYTLFLIYFCHNVVLFVTDNWYLHYYWLIYYKICICNTINPKKGDNSFRGKLLASNIAEI